MSADEQIERALREIAMAVEGIRQGFDDLAAETTTAEQDVLRVCAAELCAQLDATTLAIARCTEGWRVGAMSDEIIEALVGASRGALEALIERALEEPVQSQRRPRAPSSETGGRSTTQPTRP